MKTFLYTVEYSATKANGGRDAEVTVYRIKRNLPERIGAQVENTASMKSIRGSALDVIHAFTGQDFRRLRYDNEKMRLVQL